MKRITTFSLLSSLLMATTCKKGLTYRNLCSNDLDLLLIVEKGDCYESISYSKNTVINSNNYFPVMEDREKDYVLIDSFIKENYITVKQKKYFFYIFSENEYIVKFKNVIKKNDI